MGSGAADDLRDIEARVAECWGRRVEQERLSRRAKQLESESTSARGQLADATAIVDHAEGELSELEQVSFSRLVHASSRTTDSADARRRAEVASALARHHELGVRIARLERELAATHERIVELANPIDELDALLDRKEALLKAANDPAAVALDELQGRARVVAEQRHEIDEAFHTSAGAIAALDAVIDSLESARGWGTYDTFFGGGLISSMVKHDRLDEANDLARRAQAALSRFGRELSDVRAEHVPSIEMSDFLRFTDVWFDNFFSDFEVQSRIKDALRQAETVRASVADAHDRLAVAAKGVDCGLETLAEDRTTLLLGEVPIGPAAPPTP